MYGEVINSMDSFEKGMAYELGKCSKELIRKLEPSEVDNIFFTLSQHPQQHPYIEDARIKMASRDLHFRDALHMKLEQYIQSVTPADFERFLGEQSTNFEKQLDDAKDILKRLKQSE